MFDSTTGGRPAMDEGQRVAAGPAGQGRAEQGRAEQGRAEQGERGPFSGVLLRAATPADIAAVADIWHRGWRDGHLGHVPDALVVHRSPESFPPRITAALGHTTVAVVRGEIAGFIMVSADEVEQVYVASGHRGSGVAVTLLAEAERQVRTAGFTEAWLAVVPGNARARRFYERRGWHDTGGFDYEADTAAGHVAVPCRRYARSLTV